MHYPLLKYLQIGAITLMINCNGCQLIHWICLHTICGGFTDMVSCPSDSIILQQFRR